MSADNAGPAPAAVAAWERHAGEGVEPQALRAKLVTGNLPQAFHETAREAGEKPAVSIEGSSATYIELDEAAGRTAAWLRARGVGFGERVILSGPNSLAFVIAYLGTLRAGAVAVLAGADLTERELDHMVTHSGAIAAFTAGDARGRLHAVSKRTSLGPIVALDGSDTPTLDAVCAGSDTLEPPVLNGDEVAVIGYTSGTTGSPKGAALSHSNVLASLRGVMLGWRWSADDVLVHSLPMSHQHGMAGLQATLLAGSRAVIQHGFEPTRLIEAIRHECASILFSVPAVYERLVAASKGLGSNREAQPGVSPSPATRASQSPFGSLRLATSGSAPLSTELWAQAAELIGSQPLERYGTTESGLDVSNPYDGSRKPGAVGIPLPGVEMKVVDSAGAELEPDADGEVVVRGPQVFAGYWADQRATLDSFYSRGWFRTGDVGRIDPDDGYLSITGRIKDLIISGGLNVYPREVELVLEQHPDVERAAVVGVPSERWGEAVVAFVVPAAGVVDGNELREHARELLAPYKTPKVVLSTDALPFDGFGKLRRSELAHLAVDEVE